MALPQNPNRGVILVAQKIADVLNTRGWRTSGHPLGGCPSVRWYIFFADMCPHQVSGVCAPLFSLDFLGEELSGALSSASKVFDFLK
jgi:hypothetical protein